MVISRTPFRISFFGGGTDYPAWYREHGGAVLATTIDKYCYLTCRYLPPFFEHRIRVVYSKMETVQNVEDISHPAVREPLRFLKITRGVEIHHDGDLPARSGMGSSSAFTVGILHALHALKAKMPSKDQLAREALHVEQDRLKESVGSQDQILAAYGGFNQITFSTNGEFSVKPIILPAKRMRELTSHLMLFYTGIKRTASDIASSFVHNLSEKEKHLKKMRGLVDEAMSHLRSGDDIQEFGRLMNQNWKLKCSLGAKISNPMVEECYERAMSAGALGGKLTGAGGGGFLLLFVPPSKRMEVRAKLAKLIHVPFRFEFSGSQIIFYDTDQNYAAEERYRAKQTIGGFRELAEIEEFQ
jgi:D-glycero-alpha-D-manno-heptose-7-phosphate kinase